MEQWRASGPPVSGRRSLAPCPDPIGPPSSSVSGQSRVFDRSAPVVFPVSFLFAPAVVGRAVFGVVVVYRRGHDDLPPADNRPSYSSVARVARPSALRTSTPTSRTR
uniref:Uncharacterized protein n=1 Tax=Plectus sambesii TaxID=2011161 RepID=A0A914W2U6_9BILA